jgi:chaperonin cofactor prefoldin
MYAPIKPEKPEKYWSRPLKAEPFSYKNNHMFNLVKVYNQSIDFLINKLEEIKKDNPTKEIFCNSGIVFIRTKVPKTKKQLDADEKYYQDSMRWYKIERAEYIKSMKEYEAAMIQYEKDLVAYEKHKIQKELNELTEKAAKLGLKITK